MKRRAILFFIVILGCAITLAANVEQRDLKSGKKKIRSVVLLPIRINLSKVSMKGAEALIDEAHNSELPLGLEIEAALRDLGYQLDREIFSAEKLAKSDDERYAVDDLQKKLDSQLQLIRRKSKDIRKGRFTLSDEVLKLPLSDSVDALLFVRVRGETLTESRKAFTTFVAPSKGDFVSMDFVLVDAKSGEVLYFSKFTVASGLPEGSEEIAPWIAKAFGDLRRAGPPLHPALQEISNASSVTRSDQPIPALGDQPGATTKSQRIPLSQAILKDLLIQKVSPEYPGIAASSHVEGDVVMQIVIDATGRVGEVNVISGPVQLIPAATSSVKQWRYRPLIIDGQAFEIETHITETFRLSR